MAQLVRDRWPVLAAQVETALREAGESVLADRWRDVYVVHRCPCEDDFCQSFYTASPYVGPPGPTRNVHLDAPWPGYLILTVEGEQITYVEVLYRPPLD